MTRQSVVACCLAVWSFSIAACCFPDDKTSKSSGSSKQVADEALQKKRADVIEGYKKERVIHKVEGETVAKLHVMPRFYTLPFDDKKTIASLVYTWFYKCPLNPNADDLPMGDHVQIIDHANGKQVGSYDPRGGLSMDK